MTQHDAPNAGTPRSVTEPPKAAGNYGPGQPRVPARQAETAPEPCVEIRCEVIMPDGSRHISIQSISESMLERAHVPGLVLGSAIRHTANELARLVEGETNGR